MHIKNNLFLLFISSMMLMNACGDDDCEMNRQDMIWSENKSIEIMTFSDTLIVQDTVVNIIEYIIRDGEGNLFEYSDVFNICDPDIADGVGFTEFSMVIPRDSINSFSYRDEEILETSAFVNVFAAPDANLHQSVKEGEIRGIRIDESSWQITINIISSPQSYGELMGEESIVIEVDAVFTLE